jgi:hypothetical protein
MTKEEGQSPVVMLNSFQHLIRFSLPLADTPFIPVHRTGFSGAISNKKAEMVERAFIGKL